MAGYDIWSTTCNYKRNKERRRERKPAQAHRHTLSGLLCGPVSSADTVPWRSWEIVSMPGPTKASFQPPACLTCAGSALCFVPRDPRVTRGHSQGPGVKSRCLRLISPQLRYPSKSALKFAPPPPPSSSAPSLPPHMTECLRNTWGTAQSNWTTVE